MDALSSTALADPYLRKIINSIMVDPSPVQFRLMVEKNWGVKGVEKGGKLYVWPTKPDGSTGDPHHVMVMKNILGIENDDDYGGLIITRAPGFRGRGQRTDEKDPGIWVTDKARARKWPCLRQYEKEGRLFEHCEGLDEESERSRGTWIQKFDPSKTKLVDCWLSRDGTQYINVRRGWEESHTYWAFRYFTGKSRGPEWDDYEGDRNEFFNRMEKEGWLRVAASAKRGSIYVGKRANPKQKKALKDWSIFSGVPVKDDTGRVVFDPKTDESLATLLSVVTNPSRGELDKMIKSLRGKETVKGAVWDNEIYIWKTDSTGSPHHAEVLSDLGADESDEPKFFGYYPEAPWWADVEGPAFWVYDKRMGRYPLFRDYQVFESVYIEPSNSRNATMTTTTLDSLRSLAEKALSVREKEMAHMDLSRTVLHSLKLRSDKVEELKKLQSEVNNPKTLNQFIRRLQGAGADQTAAVRIASHAYEVNTGRSITPKSA